MKIRRGNYERYLDAQWWIAIDGATEWRVLTDMVADERAIAKFISDPGAAASLHSPVLSWERRTFV